MNDASMKDKAETNRLIVLIVLGCRAVTWLDY